MKYMLLMYGNEGCWTDEERKACMIESMGICDQLAAQGKYVTSAPLHSVTTATSVRVRAGKTLITDGPFAETTEQLGGFYILEVENLEEAIAIASRLPPTKKGTTEIRPVFELAGLPTDKFLAVEASDGSKMKFMLLCYDDEEAWRSEGPAALQAAMAEAAELTRQLDAKGKYLSASPLHPVSTATSVRIRNGQRIISDGPFAETREVLGGYYLILARDREEAVRIATQHSGARVGTVEVRPVFDVSTLNRSPESLASDVDSREVRSTLG